MTDEKPDERQPREIQEHVNEAEVHEMARQEAVKLALRQRGPVKTERRVAEVVTERKQRAREHEKYRQQQPFLLD